MLNLSFRFNIGSSILLSYHLKYLRTRTPNMARYGLASHRAIIHPYYKPPQPPAEQPQRPTPLIKSGYPRNQIIGGLNDSVLPMVLGDDPGADAVILMPIDYDGNDLEEYWREQTSGYQALKTCIAYEQLRGDHPRVARYISRDPWAGLPILSRPTGPSLEEFIKHHQGIMYPTGTGNHTVSEKFLPLVLNWSLQALSGLTFIHSHNDYYYNDLTVYNCWLSSDFSLSLIGFLNAEFRDEWGQLNDGRGNCKGPMMRLTELEPRASVKSDLFDWGTFVYQLMTNDEPGEGTSKEVRAQIRQQEFPTLSRNLMGEIVTKCWMQQYDNAGELRGDLVRFLQERGYEVDGDGDTIKDFHP